MKSLLRIARDMLAAEPKAFLRGAILGVTVLAMGAALLGLSGWFVTACAMAGIAGIGIDFDFFRPSAGVRLLALGRAGARYGERMLTHDATLRALSALRLRLYRGVARLPFEAQTRLRGAEALNRLTSDVDALDGLLLRLLIPVATVLTVLAVSFVTLWFLVAPAVAWSVTLAYLAGGALALIVTARRAHGAAEAAETALQSLRARTLDMAQSRADLTVAGALLRQRSGIGAAVAAEVTARNRMEAADRAGGFALSLTTGIAAAAALLSGGMLAQAGTITPAEAAIGFFVAMALGEGPALLRRGLTELGRMQVAARRVTALCDTPVRPEPASAPAREGSAPLLVAQGLTHRRAGSARATFGPLDLTLTAGETVLISGPSGAGKSTLLSVLSGLIPATSGTIALEGQPLADWPEAALRSTMTLLPQRSALIGGTVAENLALALPAERLRPAPESRSTPPEARFSDPDRVWQILDALELGEVLRRREGLATVLGPGGSGLSGGQSRRLVLARALLREPDILLLDEPSEGLDPDTAAAVLGALRTLLPEAGIILVSHRPADRAFADREIAVARS
ncbi:amino acid ABC transporter ATP-binding/permease protein [Paenirhodobacter enshiensis]|uniref:amino acid ABC transporter ATP-binding/permease protein n=1 Tax=Paenirhodobacter enshiensis TaxID=1105367 RepID=UPI0035AF8013